MTTKLTYICKDEIAMDNYIEIFKKQAGYVGYKSQSRDNGCYTLEIFVNTDKEYAKS